MRALLAVGMLLHYCSRTKPISLRERVMTPLRAAILMLVRGFAAEASPDDTSGRLA